MSAADPAAVQTGRADCGGILSQGVAFGLCAVILAGVTAAVFLVGRGTMLDKDPVPLHRSLSQSDKCSWGRTSSSGRRS